jgi:uncharacterized protein YndB with AHSA1/START domain
MAERNSSNEIQITRVYDAPLKTVWEAWTEVKHLEKWWGPRGFTITSHKKDTRTGGVWDYTMHGPDGVDYPNITRYLEVEKHSHMIYDHGATADRPPLFRVHVRFSEQGGKTTMDMRMILATPEVAEQTRGFIKKAGGNATWDRLAEHLAKEATGEDRFVINRSFNAPIARVFGVWTTPDQLAQWLPPTGATMVCLEGDIREGGGLFYRMDSVNHAPMYGRTHYLEIRRPDRLVYTQQFCDEKGGMGRHPLAPTWPAVMQTTVVFAAEGPNHTRVTVTWEVHGEATDAERATFASERGGMTQGWTGSFDKLEGHLEAPAT